MELTDPNCLHRQAGIILLPPEQGWGTVREPYRGGVKSIDLTTQTPFQETLEQAGITRETANTWQKVGRVPEDKFELYFKDI